MLQARQRFKSELGPEKQKAINNTETFFCFLVEKIKLNYKILKEIDLYSFEQTDKIYRGRYIMDKKQ